MLGTQIKRFRYGNEGQNYKITSLFELKTKATPKMH